MPERTRKKRVREKIKNQNPACVLYTASIHQRNKKRGVKGSEEIQVRTDFRADNHHQISDGLTVIDQHRLDRSVQHAHFQLAHFPAVLDQILQYNTTQQQHSVL